MLRVCSNYGGRCAAAAMQHRAMVHVAVRSVSSTMMVATPSPTRRNLPARSKAWRASGGNVVGFSRAGLSTLSEEELRRKMDDFNDLFVTAREEIELAGESKETTYFDAEAAAAKEAVDEAVMLFEQVLSSVDEKKRMEIMRASGLRVEQLKAELDQLLTPDDH